MMVKSSIQLVSVPDPKPTPSTDHFQYTGSDPPWGRVGFGFGTETSVQETSTCTPVATALKSTIEDSLFLGLGMRIESHYIVLCPAAMCLLLVRNGLVNQVEPIPKR